MSRIIQVMGLAQIIDHNVECNQEGIHVYHCELLSWKLTFAEFTLEHGYLLFHVFSLSHQAFKFCGTS